MSRHYYGQMRGDEPETIQRSYSNGLATPTFRHQPMSISPRSAPHPTPGSPETSFSPRSSSNFISYMFPLASTFSPTPLHQPKTEEEAKEFLNGYIERTVERGSVKEENEKKSRTAVQAPQGMALGSPMKLGGDEGEGPSPDPLGGWSVSPLKRKKNVLSYANGGGGHDHSPTKPSGLSRSISSKELYNGQGSGSSSSRKMANHSRTHSGNIRMEAVVEIPVRSPKGPRTRSRSPKKNGNVRRVLYKEENGDAMGLNDDEDGDGSGDGDVEYGEKVVGLPFKRTMMMESRPRTPFMSSSRMYVTAGSSQSKQGEFQLVMRIDGRACQD